MAQIAGLTNEAPSIMLDLVFLTLGIAAFAALAGYTRLLGRA